MPRPINITLVGAQSKLRPAIIFNNTLPPRVSLAYSATTISLPHTTLNWGMASDAAAWGHVAAHCAPARGDAEPAAFDTDSDVTCANCFGARAERA